MTAPTSKLLTVIRPCLRPNESCCLALNAFWEVQDYDTLIPVTVAVIINREREPAEACIVLLADYRGTAFIAANLPIYSTTNVRINDQSPNAGESRGRGQGSVEVFNQSQLLTLQMLNPEDTESLRLELRRAVRTARSWCLLSGGGTHQWLDFYLPTPQVRDWIRDDATNISSLYSSLKLVSSDRDIEADTVFRADPLSAKKTDQVHTEIQNALLTLCEPLHLNVWVGTWNVNEKSPPNDLRPWMDFLPDKQAVEGELDDSCPKILAFGIQELDMSSSAFVYHDQNKDQAWYDAISMTLGSLAGSYKRVVSKRLVGMLVAVYVHESIQKLVPATQRCQVNCGFMHIGNKGAVSARIQVAGCSIAFVNVHLAAHQGAEYAKERNRQAHVIFDGLRFGPTNQDFQDPSNMLYNSVHAARDTLTAQPRVIRSSGSDIVVFFGDMNYRVNPPKKGGEEGGDNDNSTVQQHQQQQQQQQQPEESLADIRLEYDELTHEKTPGSVFEDFQEAPISFGPTFKFVVGSSVHDTKRRPAWTDRILWCTKRCAPDVEPWFKFTNRRYRSHPELTTSDHKPVSALFTLDTLVLSEAKYKKALSEFLRRVDEDENRLASTVSISKNELDFGQIDYQRPVIEVLTLTNSGDFAVSFEFIRKPGESRLFAPWLRVIPQQGRIAPRSELKLNFIASTRAARLEGAMMDGTVHDWAILQLENQKLIFITVTGESRPSYFGTSLEHISWSYRPKAIEAGDADEGSTQSSSYDDDERDDGIPTTTSLTPVMPAVREAIGASALPIPAPVTKLVEFLLKYGRDTPGMFAQPGDAARVRYVCQCIDEDREIDPDVLFSSLEGASDLASKDADVDDILATENDLSVMSIYTPVSSTPTIAPEHHLRQQQSNSDDITEAAEPRDSIGLSTTSRDSTTPLVSGKRVSTHVLVEGFNELFFGPKHARSASSSSESSSSSSSSSDAGNQVPLDVLPRLDNSAGPTQNEVHSARSISEPASAALHTATDELAASSAMTQRMNKISGVLSVAQCLLTLLRVLPESVVPADAFERFIGINSPKDEILERLCRLYPMHYSLLMYISGSLKPLLTKNKYLRPKQAHIITLFAKIMMPPPVSHKEPSHSLLSMLTEAGEDGSEYATGTSKKWEEFRTSMVQYLIMFN